MIQSKCRANEVRRRIAKAAGRATLLLFVAVQVTSVAGQHGGKAEGKRVHFERGKTTATFKGRVRGDIEVEYELKADAGQELLVRMVAAPPESTFVKLLGPNATALPISCLEASVDVSKKLGLPSAARCYDDNPAKLSGRTWSLTLPASGDYTLSVFKPNGGAGVSTYTLTIILPPGDKRANQALTADDTASLDAAMRNFIAAMMHRDVERFLSLFSRTEIFYATNPLNVIRAAVSYAELAAGLRNKGDWYFTYLERGEGGAYDALIDHIGDGAMWRRVDGARFVPPDSENSNPTYVRWRREGRKWVIAEISY